MKRKPARPNPEPVISPELLEQAKKMVQTDMLKRTGQCEVCGGECAVSTSEQLCWVCRRLKISAWRDSEQQMPVQE